MASMKELFPLHNFKKIQRNFVKENIRNAKGCVQCIAERRATQSSSPERFEIRKTSSNPERSVQRRTNVPSSLKYNVKIIKRERSSSRSKNSGSANKNSVKLNTKGCQTDPKLAESGSTTCENCGHFLNVNNSLQSSLTQEENSYEIRSIFNENSENQFPSPLKDSHQLSHQNVDEKSEIISKKLQNPVSYRKGEVPRYLIERNAKLERDKQERETREKLEELLGLNDPKCPPGHMLMPPDDIECNLKEMETKFNSLIAELNRMPVSNDSFKIRQRRIEIEKELNELEEKMDLYRTKKVFIKIPELN